MFIDKASLPQHAYQAKQVQQHEPEVAEQSGLSMYQLMQKAGNALFEWVKYNYLVATPLVILCGKGNNGGDGYILAKLAHDAGYSVQVEVLADEDDIKADARMALTSLQTTSASIRFWQPNTQIHQLIHQLDNEHPSPSQALWVDALWGIGIRGELPDYAVKLIGFLNREHKNMLSVDIPSGLLADTGQAAPIAVKACHTISFIAPKQGLLTGQAANYVGSLHLADLTVGESFQNRINSEVHVQTDHNLPAFKARAMASHKGDIGLAFAIGGNEGFPGAIRLCAEAVLRSGASLTAVACHKANQALVFNGRPELMLAPDQPSEESINHLLAKAKVLVLGPGLGQDEWAQIWFNYIIEQTLLQFSPIVIDAEALRLLARSPQYYENWILTPHPGEAASLLTCDIKTIEMDRFAAVKNIAQKYGGICVLKGAGTLISDGKEVWINTSGNPGMASGGMGDVLSGIVAALVMQMQDNMAAARLAVYIHGLAADILERKEGQCGMLASDLIPVIRQQLNQLTQ